MPVPRFVLLFGAATAALAAAPAGAADSIHGRWVTQSKNAIVEVAPCGSKVCGRIQKLLDTSNGPNPKDRNNPDPKLRNRTILGLPVLSNLAADGKSYRGQIYDPESGRNYRSVVSLNRNGTLKVQGCIGPICQTQTWTRAN